MREVTQNKCSIIHLSGEEYETGEGPRSSAICEEGLKDFSFEFLKKKIAGPAVLETKGKS